MKTYALKIGNRLITDVLDPKPEQIDLDAVESRLRVMHRFSNDPEALTVHVHRVLVVLIADTLLLKDHPQRLEILRWCYHHDDHEAVTGDIPGPLKALIAESTNILGMVERRLDRAIAAARGETAPSAGLKSRVHVFDKMAETIEWVYVLDQAPAIWNADIPFTEQKAKTLLAMARNALRIEFTEDQDVEYVTINLHPEDV